MNDSGKVPTFKKSTSWINVSDFYAFWSKTQSTKSSTSKKTLTFSHKWIQEPLQEKPCSK